MDLTQYPNDDADALLRSNKFERIDPFPKVPHSLLSSAEVDDYARVTGMLSPFFPEKLKSASYEAHIGGEVIWWDESGKKHKRIIERGDELILNPNSIVFVQVEPIIRLPYYIAIRFNLRITHVHRGLLLGTGPLVDPGFRGKLLIPLHNLTSDAYSINTKEALIWIEFTKTTYGFESCDELASQPRRDATFPEDKRGLEPESYLRKANAGNPIRSSIPDAVENARKSATAAEAEISSLKRIGYVGGIVAAVTFAATLAGLAFQVGSMIQNSNALIATVQQTVVPVSGDLKLVSDKTASTQSQIDQLTQQVGRLSRDLEELKNARPNASKK